MFATKIELHDTLKYERKINLGYLGFYQILLAAVKSHPRYVNWKYIRLLRYAGYYYERRNHNILYAALYFFYCRRKNKLGRKLGIEINEKSFQKGLEIYHTYGVVVNGDSRIGENCKLHGNNCIGNNGYTKECPKIGNNVRLGVGAKIIGDVEIADDITVAAGAVVVNSFLEPGITIGGIPAKKIK